MSTGGRKRPSAIVEGALLMATILAGCRLFPDVTLTSIGLSAAESAVVGEEVEIKVRTSDTDGDVTSGMDVSNVANYEWTVEPADGATLVPGGDPKRMTFVADAPGSYRVTVQGMSDRKPWDFEGVESVVQGFQWRAETTITVRPRTIPQFPTIETTILDGRGPGEDCEGIVGLTFVLPIDPDADVPKFASLTGTCWEDGRPVFTAFDASGTFENGRFDLSDGRFTFAGTVDDATATVTITGGPGDQTFVFPLKR
jgi:hypothetical protein